MADDEFEEGLGFVDVFGFRAVGHGLGEDFINFAKVAKEHGFGAFELVGFDVVFERLVVLDHLAGDRFGADVFAAEVGVAEFEGVEGVVNKVGAGLGVFDFIEQGDAVVEFHALVLEARHQLGLEEVDLLAQHHLGVFEDGFDQRDEVEGVVFGRGVELGDGV